MRAARVQGELYRARDTKLGREVAIKVLPEAFSRDKERLARFEREALLLASLNHPGIATLHGFEKHDDVRFLVMELVEGETLEARVVAAGGTRPELVGICYYICSVYSPVCYGCRY